MKYESVSEPKMPQKVDKGEAQITELEIDNLVNSLTKYSLDDQTPEVQEKWIKIKQELDNVSYDPLSIKKRLEALISQLEG